MNETPIHAQAPDAENGSIADHCAAQTDLISATTMQTLYHSGDAQPWHHDLNGEMPNLAYYRNQWWLETDDGQYVPADTTLNAALAAYARRLDLADHAISAADNPATP